MKAFRYVARQSPDETPRFADVAVSGAASRAELDQKMGELGYEFFGVVEGAARSTTFPGGSEQEARRESSFAESPALRAPPRALPAPVRDGFVHRIVSVIAAQVALLRARVRSNRVSEEADRAAELAPIAESSTPSPWEKFALPFVLVVTLAVAFPALRSGLEHEDFAHLYQGFALPLGAQLLRPFAGDVIAVHRVFYFVLERVFGLSALPYFVLVLVTHLLNTALLFTALRRFTEKPLLSVVFASVWGMAPAHLATLDAFARYGEVLTVTCLLAALVGVSGYSKRRDAIGFASIVSWSLLIVVGAASFGLGVALAVVFPFAVALLLPAECRPLRAAGLLAPAAVIGFGFGVFARSRELGSSVEPAVVAQASAAIERMGEPVMRNAAYGIGSLFVGPLLTVTASDQMDPSFAKSGPAHLINASFALFALFALAAVLALVRGTAEGRRKIWAALLLAVAAFLVVPVARSAAPLVGLTWVSTAARYHYGEAVAIVLAAAFSASAFGSAPEGVARRGRIAVFAVLTTAALANAATAAHMNEGFAAATKAVMDETDASLHAAVAKAPAGSVVYLSNASFVPVSLLFATGLAPREFPNLGAYFVVRNRGNETFEGRRLRFVEQNPALVRDIRASAKPEIAELFVTAPEAWHAKAHIVKVPPACLHLDAYLAEAKAVPVPAMRSRLIDAMRSCGSGFTPLRRTELPRSK